MAKSNVTDFDLIFKEFEARVANLVQLVNSKLSLLIRYFCVILSNCQNVHNQHFVENALILFTFVQYEIDALTSGNLPIDGQEKLYKGFISKQFGSFDKSIKNKTTRLTTCCAEYLSSEAQSSRSEQVNVLINLKHTLQSYSGKLQLMADEIVTSLKSKNKGKGGFKFILSVKYYNGYKYVCECSADVDSQGNKISRVSDGDALLKHAIDVQKRDLTTEINSLTITPLRDFPHGDIIATENVLIAEEAERVVAEQLAVQRRRDANEIIAQKREEAKKRKREEKLKAEAALAAAESSDSTSGAAVPIIKRGRQQKKKSGKGRGATDTSCDEEDVEDEDGGFTLDDYTGGPNDAKNLRKTGRAKPFTTGDLDLRDPGYDDFDDNVVKSLGNNAMAISNFILRGGKMSLSDVSGEHQGVMKKPTSFRVMDEEWDDTVEPVGDAKTTKRKSQLAGLTFDDCESPDRSKNYLNSNFIDHGSSSDEDSYEPRVRGVSSVEKPKKQRRRKPQVKSGKSKKEGNKSRGNNSDSPAADSTQSSSDSDTKKKQRKRKVVPKAVAAGASEEVTVDDTKVRKREVVGLTEQQVVQYANINLVPFQLTAAQHQNARNERFEVDGQLMSEEEIKNLIIDDVNIIEQNLDAKFLSFIRQHIMVEVFKDVYFLSNVILFYRAKRYLLHTQPGDHVVCLWQVVLKQVATDLINELVASNEKILSKMDDNLKKLKEFRRQQRHEETLIIGSDAEVERNAQDYNDLEEYKKQMKLSKKALEEIEKVMKRRINSYSHSTGAKIVCIWAKLNGYQHLLNGNMNKFEKKFLLDVTMPFYSVLSDDLSRRWGDVVLSPNSLFPGMDLGGSNNSQGGGLLPVQQASSVEILGDDFEKDVDERSSAGVSSSPLKSTRALSPRNIPSPPTSPTAQDAYLSPQRVHFKEPSSDATLSEDTDTPPQTESGASEEMIGGTCHSDQSFASPVSDSVQNKVSDNESVLVPSRPLKTGSKIAPKAAVYTSAMLSGSPLNGGTPLSQSSQDHTDHYLTSGSKEFLSPSVSSSGNYQSHPPSTQRRGGMFSVTSRVERNSVSYLSTVSSNSSSSDNSPSGCMPTSNAAVLFDEMKHMSTDPQTVSSMLRFIKVMNEKPPNVQMPVTSEEEEKILKKAQAKQKKEDAKKAIVAEDAKKAAALLAAAVVPIAATVADKHRLSSEDDTFDANFAVGGVRQRTDSYAVFQKLFLFICKRHVEVKDSLLNLQFFGQRLVKSMSNSALLSFLLLLFREKDKPIDHLVAYLLDEKALCAELNCVFGLAYNANDYFNILGDGYCVLRSIFALMCNERAGYTLSTAEMRAADVKLFKSKKSRGEYYSFLNITRESINLHCLDENVKNGDKKKMRTIMTLFGSFPQLKQLPAAYWGCLDWVAYAQGNCTAFSTNYSDCVPGYAQLHCSSVVRRDMSVSVTPYSTGDVYRILNEPIRLNCCVLEGQHTFVVKSPTKHAVVSSFTSVLGMFLSVCLKSIDAIAVHATDFPLVEEVLGKMIKDNAYALTEAEAKVVTGIVRFADGLSSSSSSADVLASDKVVLCSDGCEPPASVEAFTGSRVGDGVIDLCDSDTGDVDRTKMRSINKARLAKQEQELLELNFKFEASERENKFLLRLIGKDPLLMHNPPLEIEIDDREV